MSFPSIVRAKTVFAWTNRSSIGPDAIAGLSQPLRDHTDVLRFWFIKPSLADQPPKAAREGGLTGLRR